MTIEDIPDWTAFNPPVAVRMRKQPFWTVENAYEFANAKGQQMVFRKRLTNAIILASFGAAGDFVHAEEPTRCISREHQPEGTGLDRGGIPSRVHGLAPMVSLRGEGQIELFDPVSDCCDSRMSPAGDWTSLAGPYDPKSRRLYLWGYDSNGWIEVLESGATWSFGESGYVAPTLYFPANDIEDATPIRRSAILGVQFYSGFTAPFWLMGTQSYRVYQIDGVEMERVAELEAMKLEYLGDDVASGLAVFHPQE